MENMTAPSAESASDNPVVVEAKELRKEIYRAEKKSLQILLSSTQAGPGRKVKQGQEEISSNHVPRLKRIFDRIFKRIFFLN